MSLLPAIIEVALGTALVFLVLSGICSTLAELLSNLLDLRSRYLKQGIIALLSDPARFKNMAAAAQANGDLASRVLQHPLLQKLDPFQGQNRVLRRLQQATNTQPVSLVPSVPSDLFASVLVDQLRFAAPNYGSRLTALRMRVKSLAATSNVRTAGATPALPAVILEAVEQRDARLAVDQMRQALPLISDEKTQTAVRNLLNAYELDQIRQGVNLLPPSRGRDVLVTLLAQAENETQKIEHLKEDIARWFDNGMSQVSVWYKHNITYFLAGFAVLVCVAFNADVFRVVDILWHDPMIRETLVVQAQAVAGASRDGQVNYTNGDTLDTAQSLLMQLEQASTLPLGWNCDQVNGVLHKGFQLKPVNLIDSVRAPGLCEQVQRPTPNGGLQTLRVVGGSFSASSLMLKVLGLAVMSAGVSFGAGFWYNLLRQLLNLRSGKAS
ncbi:MAG: hypothetical protein ACM3JD_13910 [Rudaea sp.]